MKTFGGFVCAISGAFFLGVILPLFFLVIVICGAGKVIWDESVYFHHHHKKHETR
jgi:hypothetical protein